MLAFWHAQFEINESDFGPDSQLRFCRNPFVRGHRHFSEYVPTSIYSTANSQFKLTFELPEQPTPFEFYSPGSSVVGFSVLADLQYTLGTEPAFDISNAAIWFYDPTVGGMFDEVLISTSTPPTEYTLSPYGLAMFSGTATQPTMLAGTFVADFRSEYYLNVNAIEVSNLVVQVQTPEPVTGLLVGVVLLGLGVLRRRVR